MKIEVLGASGSASVGRNLTSLLINDSIALDAGSLAQRLTIERQERVRSIVLTHSHLDHTNSLPFFIENVFDRIDGPIDIYASKATIYSVRKHLFNNDSWPDFSRMPNNLLPSMKFHELEAEVPITLDGVKMTPFDVDHLVPTLGFLVEEGSEGLLWSSDTGPTHRLWELANLSVNLKALCIETSFDNSMQRIADISYHLTPRTLAEELAKLERRLPVLLHHLKPPCVEQVHREIRALENPDIHYLEEGKTYRL